LLQKDFSLKKQGLKKLLKKLEKTKKFSKKVFSRKWLDKPEIMLYRNEI
jgi:hypothetical protein